MKDNRMNVVNNKHIKECAGGNIPLSLAGLAQAGVPIVFK